MAQARDTICDYSIGKSFFLYLAEGLDHNNWDLFPADHLMFLAVEPGVLGVRACHLDFWNQRSVAQPLAAYFSQHGEEQTWHLVLT